MKKIIFFLILITLIASPFLWWNSQTAPVNKNDKTPHIFVVAKGEGIKAIASDLKAKNLIKNEYAFYLLVKWQHIENKIQAGDFRVTPAMTSRNIAESLTHGALDIWVTIPEGKRAEEVAAILKDKLPGYNDTWEQTLKENEGYLFPDTYLFDRNAQISSIVSILKNTFADRYKTLTLTNTSYSQEQLVTLASIVEREGRTDIDRPIIASVFLNRLKVGMPLQVDATIQYALGYNTREQTWWKKNLTTEDISFKSAYNTYNHTGLPPGPIASPGLAALQAVADSPKTDYLYYLADSSGKTHFAKTLAEHNANIKKYGL